MSYTKKMDSAHSITPTNCKCQMQNGNYTPFSTQCGAKFAFSKMSLRQLTRSFFPSLVGTRTKPFSGVNRASIRIPNLNTPLYSRHRMADSFITYTKTLLLLGLPFTPPARLRHPIIFFSPFKNILYTLPSLNRPINHATTRLHLRHRRRHAFLKSSSLTVIPIFHFVFNVLISSPIRPLFVVVPFMPALINCPVTSVT